jgi:hypothetical protein
VTVSFFEEAVESTSGVPDEELSITVHCRR